MTPFKDEAIYELYPNAERVIGGVTVLDSDGNEISIDESLVNAKMAEMQAAYDAQNYARNRALEYPPIGDQLDDLFKQGAFSSDMAAKLQAVKDKYPKS